MGKDKIKSRNMLTRDEVIAYLESMINGLRQGALIMDNEDRPMVLRPSDAIEAELEVKQKSDREKFSVSLSWIPNKMQPLAGITAEAFPCGSGCVGGEDVKKK